MKPIGHSPATDVTISIDHIVMSGLSLTKADIPRFNRAFTAELERLIRTISLLAWDSRNTISIAAPPIHIPSTSGAALGRMCARVVCTSILPVEAIPSAGLTTSPEQPQPYTPTSL